MAPGGITHTRFSTEPRRGLLTPSASPSVGPPAKRPRLRSTPSSVTPSVSNESTSSSDVNSARRASTLRVLNVWAQLAERYNKRLDEDDIIDLYSGAIIKDRGVVSGASRDYHIGHFAQPGDDQDPDAEQDHEDSEQDDDDNELNTPLSEATTDDDAPISKKELLRGVPPLSTTTDAEDLKEFMEAEKKRKEVAGEEEEEVISPERLSTLRKVLEEHARKKEAVMANHARDVASADHSRGPEADATPTRPSTRGQPPSDDESEDELGVWTHDESTAVYPVTRDESEQDVREVEREVIELTDLDSDEEFEAILVPPPRSARASPLPVPHQQKGRQPPQSPPNSGRGRPKSRTHLYSDTKTAVVMQKSEDRPRSPLVPLKVEAAVTRRKSSARTETEAVSSESGVSDREATSLISHKGKEIQPLAEEYYREKKPKPPGVVSGGRKRKRIVSSPTTGGPLPQSPEPKVSRRTHEKSTSQSTIVLPLQDGSKSSVEEEVSTPARRERAVTGSSRPSSPFSSVSRTQQHTPAYSSLEPQTVKPFLHDQRSNMIPLSDTHVPVTLPYLQRYPSHSPPILSPVNQGTPSLSHSLHPPPLDPVQTQQAHLLLVQAMHQLSCLISATIPSYAAYASSPGHPWHHPLPHDVFNTPSHPPRFHSTHPYHMPSSSVTPAQSLAPSPAEEQQQRIRSRARSRSRGKRVSFKLDCEQIIGDQVHNNQPEFHHNGQRNRKPSFKIDKREKGHGKAGEEFDDSARSEECSSPPREVSRGRTPGPPDHKKK